MTRTFPLKAIFRVVGTSFEQRPDVINALSVGDTLMLSPDESNPHDANAIEVRTPDGAMVGFVPGNLAERVLATLKHSPVIAKVEEVFYSRPPHSNAGLRISLSKSETPLGPIAVSTLSGRPLGSLVAKTETTVRYKAGASTFVVDLADVVLEPATKA